MNLGQFYKYVLDILNKDISGNATNIDKLNSFLYGANIRFFNIKVGLPEEYGPGQPLPRQALDLNQVITEDMDFCKVDMGGSSPVMIIDSNGIADKPSDFVRLAKFTHKYTKDGEVKEAPVEVVFDNKWGIRVSSEIRKPRRSKPICRFGSGYVEFRPKDLRKVNFTYYRLPKTPFFDYVTQNDNPVYLPPGQLHDGTGPLLEGTPSRSVELEWPGSLHDKLAVMVANMFAGSIKDGSTYQDTEKIKNTGK